jgi:uncharacterized protein with ParB-like and HNH nuclease domain
VKIRDIPQLTSVGSYQVNMPFRYITKNIIEWIEDDYYKLQLNPDFQRGHVWTEQQQIKYIEYLLRGGKSARIIYFNKPSWQSKMHIENGYDDFVCVDGLQRLTAVMKFMDNKLKVFGFYLNEFEDKLPPTEPDLLFNINDLKTRKEVLRWYIEFNSGGTVHTEEEIMKVKRLLFEEESK